MSDDKPSIFDFQYQRARLEYGKRESAQEGSCLFSCFAWIFKHLLHLFMFVFVISFAVMLHLNKEDQTDNMGLQEEDASTVKMMDMFISHHPVYYGIMEGAKKAGIVENYNTTDGLL